MDTPAATVNYSPLPSIVFQCGGCKTIVGDSSDAVCTLACGSLQLVVLQAMTEVTVDKVCTRARPGAGLPGSYFPVCCTGCGCALGRLYTEAAPGGGLAVLVNNFSLDASKCTSYELGTADIRVMGQAGAAAAAIAAAAAAAEAATPTGAADGAAQSPGSSAAAASAAAVAELAAKVELLQAELLKMQGMVILHEEQLQQLPMHHSQSQGLPPGAATAFGQPTRAAAAAAAAAAGGGGVGEVFASELQYQSHLRTTMGAG